MLYDIGLTIQTEFEVPVSRAHDLVRVMPATIPGVQTLVSGLIEITPRPITRRDRLDFFGTALTDVRFAQPLGSLSINLRARVERRMDNQPMDLSPRLSDLPRELAEVRTLGPASPQHFRAASPRVAQSEVISAFARSCADAPGLSVLALVRSLGERLHHEMRFEAGVTDVRTPPEEAFRMRRGVCQDFTHIMIAALRGIGVPAAYVSGFLRTLPPPGQPKLAGADAMHAWVRAWCGAQMGWIEYDPTNDCLAGPDHIVVGHGRDYGDVAPIRGITRGGGEQDSHHAVDVIEVAL